MTTGKVIALTSAVTTIPSVGPVKGHRDVFAGIAQRHLIGDAIGGVIHSEGFLANHCHSPGYVHQPSLGQYLPGPRVRTATVEHYDGAALTKERRQRQRPTSPKAAQHVIGGVRAVLGHDQERVSAGQSSGNQRGAGLHQLVVISALAGDLLDCRDDTGFARSAHGAFVDYDTNRVLQPQQRRVAHQAVHAHA